MGRPPAGPGASPTQMPWAITDGAIGPGDRQDVEPLNARGWRRNIALASGVQGVPAPNAAAVSGVSHQPMVLRVQWMDSVESLWLDLYSQGFDAVVRVTCAVDGGSTVVSKPFPAWGVAFQFPAGSYTVEIVCRNAPSDTQPQREVFLHASPGFLRDRCVCETYRADQATGEILYPPAFATCLRASLVGDPGSEYKFVPQKYNQSCLVNAPAGYFEQHFEAQPVTLSGGNGGLTLCWTAYE